MGDKADVKANPPHHLFFQQQLKQVRNMKKFILNFFHRIGIGVNSNINNINNVRVQDIFPDYKFKKGVASDLGNGMYSTIIHVMDNDDNIVFTLSYTHTESGKVTNVSYL